MYIYILLSAVTPVYTQKKKSQSYILAVKSFLSITRGISEKTCHQEPIVIGKLSTYVIKGPYAQDLYRIFFSKTYAHF